MDEFEKFWQTVLEPMAAMYKINSMQAKNIAQVAWQESKAAEYRRQAGERRNPQIDQADDNYGPIRRPFSS
jgi:hypothetical protein